MEQLLTCFADPALDPAHDLTPLFTQLISKIRPRHADDSDSARRNLQALCHILNSRPELRHGLRAGLRTLGAKHSHSALYTTTGILPNTGFVSEFFRRVGHKILPEALDADLLRTPLRQASSPT